MDGAAMQEKQQVRGILWVGEKASRELGPGQFHIGTGVPLEASATTEI